MTFLVSFLTASMAAADDRPNIMLIMVDDLGKEWIGSYGAEGIETLTIDALASGGMQFENAWCMPQCTPTRVTLLTGEYPFQHGWTNHWDVPRWGAGCHFDPSLNPSFPRLLRDAGYATCAAGKWQIDDFRVEPRAMEEAGFDEWCMWTGYETGNPPSGKRYWDAYVHSYTGGEDQQPHSSTHEGKFGPDVYCDFLIDFMRRHKDERMFIYFPMALTHGPLVTTPAEPGVVTAIDRHRAMVRYTDSLVGRLIACLDELGIRDETIVIFTTDNGTSRGITGIRNGQDVRGAKAQMNEAGTAMPFIVNCPGRVPKGIVTNAITDFTDIFPTLLELAGIEAPAPANTYARSIAPLLLGKTTKSQRQWILSVGGHPARLRDGRVVPSQDYDDRVLRNERYKIWVDSNHAITRLHDMEVDPIEEINLLDSTELAHVEALAWFAKILTELPQHDATPRYKANPPQPWDRKK